MIKKSILTTLVFIIITNTFFVVPTLAKLDVGAESAILVDGRTGRVLFSKKPNAQKSIASVTKVMTAILVIENASPEEVVTVDISAERTAESEIYLEKNEKMTVENLLYALMLQSANDAAVALAKHISPSVPEFAELMNEKAKKLKMNDSIFYNPHGLGDTNISTASDLAKLGRYALRNPIFSQIVKTKEITINGKRNRKVYNRNKLLWRYPYAIGIKTGYTKGAGSCLLSAAKKRDMSLIAVTLKAKDHENTFTEAQEIFDWAYKNFRYHLIAQKGKVVSKVNIPFNFKKMSLGVGKDFGVISSKVSNLKTKINLSKSIELPIKKGDTLGQLKVYEGKELLAEEPLKARSSAGEVGFFSKLTYWIKYLFKKVAPV
ncbi:MAG: D-alanyl-D-alanine carboxypeptidase [Actinobacteria bacterium]|nr:MAG: D-alanyl-D-alanine carboxypeptidase [Actinomycetota bacterium]